MAPRREQTGSFLHVQGQHSDACLVAQNFADSSSRIYWTHAGFLFSGFFLKKKNLFTQPLADSSSRIYWNTGFLFNGFFFLKKPSSRNLLQTALLQKIGGSLQHTRTPMADVGSNTTTRRSARLSPTTRQPTAEVGSNTGFNGRYIMFNLSQTSSLDHLALIPFVETLIEIMKEEK